MGERSEALAEQLDRAVKDFATTVESCSDKQWSAICGDEGWTVAATAQHVAGQFPLEHEFISAAAEARTMPAYTWDDINGMNDRRAGEHSSCTKADVLTLLHHGGSSMSAYIRALTDEQLDRTASLGLAGGASVSAQQLIEGGVLIEHVTGHLASIRTAE